MSFETFQCQEICGELFLARDDKEVCWLSNSRQMFYVLAVATPALLFYLLFLPSLTSLYLYRHRQVLRTDRKLILRFGLLFSGYSSERWYWEVIVILRKLVLIVIVTFGESSQSQLHFALGALIVLLYLQERGRPFESSEGTAAAAAAAAGTADVTSVVSLTVPSAVESVTAAAAANHEKAQNHWLHLMEVASLLVLVTMVWVSVFFTISTCGSSSMECTVLSVVVLASNLAFFLVCSFTCFKSFNERNHLHLGEFQLILNTMLHLFGVV